MATIAAYTSPSIGHLLPLVGVLLELQSRGHRIRLRTLKREVPRMRALGFEVGALDPRLERLEFDDWRSRPMREGMQGMIATFCARGELEGPDLRSMLQEARPDLVITDLNTWGAAAVAEASGLPWVAFAPTIPLVRSKGWPPYGPGFPPGSGWRAAVRDAMFDRLALGPAERMMVHQRNALRARLADLTPVCSAGGLVRRAPLTLVTTAEPLEYHHVDWEPDLQLVGPTTWEPPAEPLPWLDEIDGPIVLVTVSSEFQRDGAIVRTAFAALRDEPVTLVATMPTGSHARIHVPPNGRLVEHAPHGQLLDRAVCAITHGGLGVTQKALGRRVPVVVVPWGRDQFEVAARVEHARAGVRVRRRQLTPERLRDAVAEARGMREGVEAVAAGLAAAGGPARAATLVEQELARSAVSPPTHPE